MTDSVVALAARCAVAIYSGPRFLGSGFFAAPGQVLTCAHVAAKGGAGPLTVRWGGTEHTAIHTQLIPPQSDPGRRTYDPPDLALITVDEQPGQPFAWLADRDPDADADVLCLGFSEATTKAGVATDSIKLQVAAGSGGGFIRVQQGEIPLGMSGSLALDIGTKRVCGVVKTSRDTEAPRGGWIIPVSVIAGHLGAVIEKNAAGHGPTSPWRQLATRHAEFERRLFNSRPGAAGPRGNVPPSWWLDPRHRATRFQDRPELESLLAWACDEDPATPVARLLTGEGGSGKTRLAVELAGRLAVRGWVAGLLTADDLPRLPLIAEALHEILAYGHRVLIALDYPEGMGDGLTRFLARLPLPDEGHGGGMVRVLLLARFGGGWWDTLHPAGDIKYLIDREPVQLTPLCPDPDAAACRFGEALQDYRLKILGPGAAGTVASARVVPPALTEAARQHATAIRLHALALVSALHEREHGVLPDGEAAWADPLDALVNHERRHWAEAGRVLSCTRDTGWAGRILLVPTLLAVYRSEEGKAAIARIPGFAGCFPGEAPEAAALLRDLYPPDESASLRWWSPLPLDRLGETLLTAVLKDFTEDDDAAAYMKALLLSVSLPEAIQGLTVLTRLGAGAETPEPLRATIGRCLDMLTAADGSRLLPALLVADRQVPPGAQRPGERYLARLDCADAMTLVQRLNGDRGHRLLQETGLALLDHAERALDTEEMRFSVVAEPVREFLATMQDAGITIPADGLPRIHAKALRAELLMRLGRAGEAIGLAEEAARAMRAIYQASSGPGVLHDDLLVVAGSAESEISAPVLDVLDTYAEALATVGRLSEAAVVRRECAAVARQASGKGGPDSERTVVTHEYKLAETLLELGQPAEAEQHAREMVERTRSLSNPALRAAALATWARTLDRIGRQADASAVAADAAVLFRQLAGATGDRVLAAQAIHGLGHLAPPDAAGLDLLTELRAAASRDPASASPAFVLAAIGRAEDLAGHADVAGARRQMSEALGQARRLARDDPDTHLHVVARVLGKSAVLGCGADPVAEIGESARIFRRMVDEYHRDDVRADLALALMQHALLLRDAGRDADALPGFAEAIELLRPLLAQDRWSNTPYLCTALNLFAETAAKHGDPEQAVAAAREAIDLEISRTDDLPPTPAEHLPQFRRTLFLALTMLMGVREEQGAATAVITALLTELCGIARGLPDGTLDAHDLGIFASSLEVLGVIQYGSGHPEDALAPLDEATAILRGLPDSGSARDPSLLLQIGTTRVAVYRRIEQHAETARVMAEVLDDCRGAQPGWERERCDRALMATEVITELARHAHAAESLRLAAELARTCREWLPLGDIGLTLLAAAVPALGRCLTEATSSGVAPDEWPTAAAEVSAGAALLAERAPGMLRAEHAQAIAQAASTRAAAGQLAEALNLTTRAADLYQNLAADDGDVDPLPGLAILVQQGTYLSALGRREDATGPLERALPVLLAAGQDISPVQAMLLRSTLDLLRQAYRALGKDTAIRSMVEAFHASGVPPVVHMNRPIGKTGDDLHSMLRAAENDAADDPERAITVFRELLNNPAGTRDYLTARVACGRVVTALSEVGRYSESLRLCDLLITSGRGMGLGDWAQLDGKCRQLNVRIDAGLDPRIILAEATALTARTEELMADTRGQGDADLTWVRETLSRASARAALRLGQWPDALRFVRAEADSMRNRGASLPDVAFAEFNAYSALTGAGRVAEAAALLDRCEAAFREDHDGRDLHLGLVAEARADLAANTGDPGRAVGLQSQALARLYQSRNVGQIQHGHAALSMWHTQADQHSPLALAHALAAGMIAELTGHPPDIEAIMRTMVFRAGDCPATPALLAAVVDETPRLHFAELMERLAQSRPGPTASELLGGLLRLARDSQRSLSDELARHCMRWDPVFAAIAQARRGDFAAARAVGETLADYADSQDWSQLSQALGHIFHQRPEAVAAESLDVTDAIMLRRCTDALNGIVRIPSELAYAMPINNVLAEVLFAAQNGQTSPGLARMLESLAGQKRWQPLVSTIQNILAGNRDLQVTAGLDQASAAIITTLLGHLIAS